MEINYKKQLRIKVGVLRRIHKDYTYYQKEQEEQEEKIKGMRKNEKYDKYDIKK